MIILSGLNVRETLKNELAAKLSDFKVGDLAIIQVGNNEESNTYINQKKKFGESIGVTVRHITFPEDVLETEIIEALNSLNADKSVAGIIVQLPIPAHLPKRSILDAIIPEKDVDGLGSIQAGRLYSGAAGITPATARGILSLLDYYEIDIAGKHAVVIGRSELVGRPVALSLLNRHATVTIAHSRTQRLPELTRTADILVVACGIARYIDASYVREGQVVIDVGIHKTEEGICGDVDFESVKEIVAATTPVPGGVGPLTVVSLFQNLFDAQKMQNRTDSPSL